MPEPDADAPLADATRADATLAGYTVGITAARRREELGAALARRGATVLYGPAMRTVALADDAQLLEATKRCIATPPDYFVATTGVGFRGWVEAATAWGLAPDLLDAFAASRIFTRGPKVRGAVRAGGLREEWSPESESSAEVLDHLIRHCQLVGKRVAIQLHGDPLREFVHTLRGAGADVLDVPVYRWLPPEDEQPLHQLIQATAGASLDAVTFTSAPAAVSFLRTADELALGAEVRAAMGGRVLCAAVGPITAAPLIDAGVPVSQPERFRLGALVRVVAELLPRRTPNRLV